MSFKAQFPIVVNPCLEVSKFTFESQGSTWVSAKVNGNYTTCLCVHEGVVVYDLWGDKEVSEHHWVDPRTPFVVTDREKGYVTGRVTGWESRATPNAPYDTLLFIQQKSGMQAWVLVQAVVVSHEL